MASPAPGPADNPVSSPQPGMAAGMASHDEAVLDASVAAKWYLTDEQFVAESRVLFDRFVDGSPALVAPLHIQYEVPNAIIVAARRQPPRLSEQEALAAIRDFL